MLHLDYFSITDFERGMYLMEYANDLRRLHPQDYSRPGEYTEATAMLPDRLGISLVATILCYFRWQYRALESRCLGAAVGIRRLSIHTTRPVWFLRCRLRVSIASAKGRFAAEVLLGRSAFFGYCGEKRCHDCRTVFRRAMRTLAV